MTPRFRADLVVVEQVYRGQPSYIVKDPLTHKYFRFRPVEVMVMQAFDGTRTPADVVTALAAEGVTLTVKTVVAFAERLGRMELLERTLAERASQLVERNRAARQRRLRPGGGDILRIRWSVGDPDKMLTALMPRFRWCFTPGFVVASAVCFAVYFLVVGTHWSAFGADVAALYSPAHITLANFAVLWLTSCTIIAIHELGHGFACKYFGGQVHEIGAMLIYFQPAFFCNVNDAWTFPERRARLWVTAAGGWIQFVIAGIAAVVWWAATPGTLVAEVALAAVLIGGITTVVANLNPLLPLDGYYALSDVLEIPNLRQRALAQVGWLVRSRLLGREVPRPPAEPREVRVLVVYGALVALYLFAVIVVVSSVLFGWASRALGAVGVLLAAAIIFLVLRERVRTWTSEIVLAVRARIAAVGTPGRRKLAGAGLALIILGAVIPWSITVDGTFRVLPRDEYGLTAPDSAVVSAVLAREGSVVPAGAPVLRLADFDLAGRRLTALRAADSLAREEAAARARGASGEAERLASERDAADAARTALDVAAASLVLRAPAGGIVLTPLVDTLLGRSVVPGQTLVRVGDPDALELRLSLAGAGTTLVRSGQPVRLVSLADARGAASRVIAVASAAGGGAVAARADVPANRHWRLGTTGVARVVVRRTNLWGGAFWGIRRLVRSDILL